ncbi:hypothetical protein ACFQ3J_06690 [Paenibacillus provencensis]|uniref:Uncharacterized protein n=1 Tax=Paenibacillus provencensis TaxID=441151 RepID=A0ABW3PTP0_9BACL|nr:hypothetical protein [Paenibacillus sp. MER 78]
MAIVTVVDALRCTCPWRHLPINSIIGGKVVASYCIRFKIRSIVWTKENIFWFLMPFWVIMEAEKLPLFVDTVLRAVCNGKFKGHPSPDGPDFDLALYTYRIPIG